MLPSLREICFTTAFSATFLAFATSNIEAATLLIRTSPRSSVLESSLLTSSYYDLNWVLSVDLQEEDNTISAKENNQKLLENLQKNSTSQDTREFIDELQDNSTPQDNQELINYLRDKSIDRKNGRLNLAESQKLLKSIRSSGLQEDNSNAAIQGKSQTISEQLQQRYQDERLGVDTEDTITVGQASKLINSVSSEDKISALMARQLMYSEGSTSSKHDLFNSDIIERNSLNKNNSSVDNLPIVICIFLLLVAANVALTVFVEKRFATTDGSLMDAFGNNDKSKVSDKSIFLHNRLMQEIQRLAARLQHLDDDKFTEAEFLRFLRWENDISQGKNEYRDLKEPIQLLQVGLNAKNSFLSLEQAEFRYRGSRQQEFYKYIICLLQKDLTKEQFRTEIENKLTETLPTLMTEEGQQALISYAQELYKLAETNLALKLMLLFKQYDSQNYSVLRAIADIIEKTHGKNLLDPKLITSLVTFHYDDFEKVSKIIGLSKTYCTLENYIKMLQYLGLSYRHSKDYYDFKELISLVEQWQKSYKSMTLIRQQYDRKEYDLPQDFLKPIPGEKVAKKYYSFASC
jgi:hypothetical protein